MISWIVSSSIFISVFLIIRGIFGRYINSQVMYLMWVFVAIRLLIPFGISVSFEVNPVVDYFAEPDQNNLYDYSQENAGRDGDLYGTDYVPATEEEFRETAAEKGSLLSLFADKCDWKAVWLLGSCISAILIFLKNCMWHKRIRRSRRLYPCGESPVPVYVVKWLQSPCMAGIIHPAVYVNERFLSVQDRQYILGHELTHYRHRDCIWTLIQMICLCIHWFNPLVWLSAVLCRVDCECACDAAAVAYLSEKEKIEYGKLLVKISACRNGVLMAFPSMSMNGKVTKKRVKRVLDFPKKRITSSAVLIFLVFVLFFCTAFRKESVSDVLFSGKTENGTVMKSGTFGLGGWNGSHSLEISSDGRSVTAKTVFPQNNQWEATRKVRLNMVYTNGSVTKTKSDTITVHTIPYEGGSWSAEVTLCVPDDHWRIVLAESKHEVITINGIFDVTSCLEW